jgi:hypothetical protein
MLLLVCCYYCYEYLQKFDILEGKLWQAIISYSAKQERVNLRGENLTLYQHIRDETNPN